MGSDDQGTKKPSFFTKTQIENDVVRTLSLSLSLESEVTPPSNNLKLTFSVKTLRSKRISRLVNTWTATCRTR